MRRVQGALVVLAPGGIAMLAMLAGPRAAHALGPLDTLTEASAQSVRLDTGLEAGVIGALAYGRRLPDLGGAALAWEARVGVQLITPDLGDSSWAAGAQLEVWRADRWRLRNQLDLTLRLVQNGIFHGSAVGLRDTLSFGWFARRGFVGLDLGWEQGLATHVRHSDYYRDYVYAEAEDGWRALAVGTARAGLFGGVVVTRRLVIAGRVGVEVDRTGRFAFLPIAATITLAWGF